MKVITGKVPQEDTPGTRGARISVSLRNLSRQPRRELVKSNGYRALRRGAISHNEYAELLIANHAIRRRLEDQLNSLNGRAPILNVVSGERSTLLLDPHVKPEHMKADVLRLDITNLLDEQHAQHVVSLRSRPLIEYIDNVRRVFPAALLGVLYMLEETLTYGGPAIARQIDKALKLDGQGTSYLNTSPEQLATFLEFRRSLDQIRDFQTQVNIVTASTIFYRLFHDMLNGSPQSAPRSGA